MKKITAMALCAGLALFGCKKGDDAQATAKGTAATPGTLTVSSLQGAKDIVKMGDEWDASYAKLVTQMGNPTEVAGNTYRWAMVDGETCYSYETENNGGKVGSTSSGSVNKMMKSMFDKCALQAGIEANEPLPVDKPEGAAGEAAEGTDDKAAEGDEAKEGDEAGEGEGTAE